MGGTGARRTVRPCASNVTTSADAAPEEVIGVLRLLNRYCSNCLRTQRFLDLGSHLVCECCSKRLECVHVTPAPVARRVVPWAERLEQRRDAM